MTTKNDAQEIFRPIHIGLFLLPGRIAKESGRKKSMAAVLEWEEILM